MDRTALLKHRYEELRMEYDNLNQSLNVLNTKIQENRKEYRAIFNELLAIANVNQQSSATHVQENESSKIAEGAIALVSNDHVTHEKVVIEAEANLKDKKIKILKLTDEMLARRRQLARDRTRRWREKKKNNPEK